MIFVTNGCHDDAKLIDLHVSSTILIIQFTQNFCPWLDHAGCYPKLSLVLQLKTTMGFKQGSLLNHFADFHAKSAVKLILQWMDW